MQPTAPTDLRLVTPHRRLLDDYAAALDSGWSPDNVVDHRAAHLAAIRRDPDAFLRALLDPGGTVPLPDGRTVPRLPFRLFWVWDGGFCGLISLRYRSGTIALPPHVLGHVGYTIVPTKRGRGYATRALALLLPVAAACGLPYLILTCDRHNAASRRVIEKNGGRLAWITPNHPISGTTQLFFQLATTPPASSAHS